MSGRQRRGRHRGGSADMHVFDVSDPNRVHVFSRHLVFNAPDVQPDPTLGVILVCRDFLESGNCPAQHADASCCMAHVASLKSATSSHIPHVKTAIGSASILQTQMSPPVRHQRYPVGMGPIRATWPNQPNRLTPNIAAEDCFVTRAIVVGTAAADGNGGGFDNEAVFDPAGAVMAGAAVSICAHFYRHGRCNLGADCRYLHVVNDTVLVQAEPGSTDHHAMLPPTVASVTDVASFVQTHESGTSVSFLNTPLQQAQPVQMPILPTGALAVLPSSFSAPTPGAAVTSSPHAPVVPPSLDTRHLRFRHDPYAAQPFTNAAAAGDVDASRDRSGWQAARFAPAPASLDDPPAGPVRRHRSSPKVASSAVDGGTGTLLM